jgi:hypothetical protein
MIFVMKFQAAAMSRANIDESDRIDFSLYVDEFQNFSTDSFATILSEARKYRLSLIVANQFTTQLSEEIRDAVFGNIGTITSFRVGTNDAEFLAKYFAPVFDINDLQRTPNYNAIVRMLIRGVPSMPFSMAALPQLGTPNKKLGDALKQLSYAKYGRPRGIVEEEIFERLKAPEKPVGGPLGAAGPAPARPAAPKPGGSFLDDWLAKRQQPFTPPQTGFGKKPAQPTANNQQPLANGQQAPATSQNSQQLTATGQQLTASSPQPSANSHQPSVLEQLEKVEEPVEKIVAEQPQAQNEDPTTLRIER